MVWISPRSHSQILHGMYFSAKGILFRCTKLDEYQSDYGQPNYTYQSQSNFWVAFYHKTKLCECRKKEHGDKVSLKCEPFYLVKICAKQIRVRWTVLLTQLTQLSPTCAFISGNHVILVIGVLAILNLKEDCEFMMFGLTQ